MSSTLSASALAPSSLPDDLPIFPLSGVVLLPHARLPLHVFEPRYLAMIDDALATTGRMIGIIQPKDDEGDKPNKSAPPPELYSIGCAGRITSFAEMEDGRLMIGLNGRCRFKIAEELTQKHLYRQVKPRWEKFLSDLEEPKPCLIDHTKLSSVLQPYLKAQHMEADWAAIEGMEDEDLIATLVMVCPLAPNEKQALLEAPDTGARAAMLITLLEMAALPPADGSARH
jgi:Lon protease-like protein